MRGRDCVRCSVSADISCRLKLLMKSCLLLIALAGITPAQTPTPSPAATSSPSVALPSPTPVPVAAPRVVAIEGNLELDDIIRVRIENLAEWAEVNDPSKLVPYLNGRGIKGNYPEEINASDNDLYFHLEILPQNKTTWIDLLGAPDGRRKPVAFSVGLENGSPFDSVFDKEKPVILTVISPVYGIIAVVVVLITLIFLVWLARNTSLIRERGDSTVAGKLRPYNLGRTQMAFWFFLVYASYLTIWLITDSLDTITASLLGLMGISAGTALSEALIDSGKDTTRNEQLRSLSSEKQSLEQSLPELQSQMASINARPALTADDNAGRDSLNRQMQSSRARLAEIDQQMQTLAPSVSAGMSKGFLRDILSDASGYSFHRFQIFAWTIVLGIMFVSTVYNNLTMPEFSATLLGLMGISSGTYIGFKFPEQK
jgi:hypothetical protein